MKNNHDVTEYFPDYDSVNDAARGDCDCEEAEKGRIAAPDGNSAVLYCRPVSFFVMGLY